MVSSLLLILIVVEWLFDAFLKIIFIFEKVCLCLQNIVKFFRLNLLI